MQELLKSLTPEMIVVLLAGGIALLLIIVALIIEIHFRRSVRKAATSSSFPAISGFALSCRERFIIKRSEKGFLGAPGPFPDLLNNLGYYERWIEAVKQRHARGAAARLLRFAPDRGLFECFNAALSSKGVAMDLLAWMKKQAGGFTLRRIALSGPGRDFDGSAALSLLGESMDEVREMLGDPEWASRAMAIRILSHDTNERSKMALADSLADSHPLVRILALQAPLLGDRLAFYAEAYSLFIKDSSYEVRRTAKARIMAEFPDLYAPDIDTLCPEETIHVIELLDPASGKDEEIAFAFLESGDPEQQLAAAEHLEARGSLRPLLETAASGDNKEFERRVALLITASSYQVNGFLSVVETIDSDGAFEAAARILAKGGDRRLVSTLAKRWFARMGDAPFNQEQIRVYRSVLDAIRIRGDYTACMILAEELDARRNVAELAAALLDSCAATQKDCIFKALVRLFFDSNFMMRDELRAAIVGQAPELVVPFALSLFRADRVDTPRIIRRDALILAGELKLSWALQRIMESLPTLDSDEIATLAPIVISADQKAFKSKARFILDGVDAPSRAAILAALPSTGDKSFMGDIKKSLGDADPEVRSAAVRALAAFQEDKALASGAMDLLRDPVERVRVAAVAALAEAGGSVVIKRLSDILDDANEMDEVKASLIRGLGRARNQASLQLLIDELGSRDQWAGELGTALSLRSSTKDLAQILERFKDATGELKTRMAQSVRTMGKRGEEALVELLREEIASIKPFIVEALESLGYVEARIRELTHRDREVRREAATALALVGSRAAYRGIVLAARDPDPEVRVAVTRALERLAGPEGQEMLSELEHDPDARVRKYVLWAMERVKAKAL
ncbi:hypothetical protein MASR2M48_01810 [Spirochaetota bacterium]